MDFPDHSFDHISIGNALHHLDRVDDCLREISRVLKRDGKIIITETFSDVPDPGQRLSIKIHDFFAEIDQASGIPHQCMFAKQKIVDLIRQSNLEPVYDFISESHVQPGENEAERVVKLLKKRLRQVSHHPDAVKFREKARQLEESIKNTPMAPPPTLVIVAAGGK